ncbi:MAG TPA: Txe/YoeB family addiction module toxin [Porphyromonadaceae bacterium]|jgi:toxin YoeB|uniref:Txe/YoeB family addiction module toxin n=1 Tax=Limibacterium fermenti TaxID=3229863 RepID=UPI000E882A29|nr:Txe/YoeB family addiction module toxin [Porphyromonadaceae bacterium]HBL34428.1 Txe/YoeB family addiction module toxin [Porphyromonadaceae bacterium]HBX44781.1 Txe/YoeB family addiction module toxin [Porphyromonadaceae bacterium]HCM20244.1 Txe/YoeB family addiction module toxin [Porphyromonadaceae bacterium]
MGTYRIAVSNRAKKDLLYIRKSGPKPIIRKIEQIFLELSEHPYSGTGHPEPLRYLSGNIWSRRIDKKNRLRYLVRDDVVIVVVISVLGHYDDK